MQQSIILVATETGQPSQPVDGVVDSSPSPLAIPAVSIILAMAIFVQMLLRSTKDD